MRERLAVEETWQSAEEDEQNLDCAWWRPDCDGENLDSRRGERWFRCITRLIRRGGDWSDFCDGSSIYSGSTFGGGAGYSSLRPWYLFDWFLFWCVNKKIINYKVFLNFISIIIIYSHDKTFLRFTRRASVLHFLYTLYYSLYKPIYIRLFKLATKRGIKI